TGAAWLTEPFGGVNSRRLSTPAPAHAEIRVRRSRISSKFSIPPSTPISAYDLPTTRTANDPGFTLRVGRRPGSVAGVSWYSAAGRKIFFVLGSKAMVFALGCVLTGPTFS